MEDYSYHGAVRDSDETDRPRLLEDPGTIVTSAPEARFKLGYGSIMGLIANRMIGSGIFVNAGSMFESTKSSGVTLMLWLTGILYAVSGVIIYIEYGLSVPRRLVHGEKVPIPRSGAELNYLSYLYRLPAYAKNTVPFMTTIFGVCFIIFGTMAGNAINCAIRLLLAANPDVVSGSNQNIVADVNKVNNVGVSNTQVRVIAISISILSCFIHTLSRRGGLLLNNIFAIVKVMILLLIIFTTIAYRAGAFPELGDNVRGPYRDLPSPDQTQSDNLDPSTSFTGASHTAYDYSSAFLDVIFSFSGFEQANYVLGEIANPRRKLPIALGLSAGGIALLYLAVNVCYWVVVPKQLVADGHNIAETFFILTFGSLTDNPERMGRRISCAFMAVSSLGNVIVMTYTATRVKQEIAKEGILPFPKFFAQNYDLSLGRVMKRLLAGKGGRSRMGALFRNKWLAPENFAEKTPVGAILLHLVTCVILIFGTWGMSPANAYSLLVGVAAYLMTSFFGIFLAVGILYLRFRRSAHWDEKSAIKKGWVSITAAIVFLILNLFPVVASWFKPTYQSPYKVKWFMKPMLAWVTIGAGALWWLGFIIIAKRKDRKTNTVLTIERVPEYEEDPEGSGQYVQKHETTYIYRKGRDFAHDDFPQDDFMAMGYQKRKEAPVEVIQSDFDHV